MAACLWLALSLVMYCRFQRSFLAVGDFAAVLHDLDSSIREFSLVSSFMTALNRHVWRSSIGIVVRFILNYSYLCVETFI